MIPELGHLSLILSFLLAVCLSIIPMAGTYNGKVVWMASCRSLATGMFVFVAISFAILSYAFYLDDFSVKYVANHSNTKLPVYYKLSAVWGGHEGSLLLWALILAGWTLAVSIFSKKLPLDMLARVLSIMGMIAVGFLLFLLYTSNPFERILPDVPLEGSDLNPLLQDFGLIVHPPMLYMGYVGSSAVFAFAIAALLSGRLDSVWAQWARPWANLFWAFLTIGIALGSWWAYYELGWGGWWFWDPVENASFMPWIVGTALIHCLSMTEKRSMFKSLTLFLAIFTFSLSLLGTFLVRSGVLTSVHAFASDPARGVFILAFLGVVVGGSLILFALRAPVVKSVTGFTGLSREAFLLANAILMTITVSFVLLGTLYPLITEALNLGKISVGVPYFNFFFVKIMAVVGILMGIGSMLNWKKTDFSKIRKWQVTPLLIAVALGTFIPGTLSDTYSVNAAITIAIGSWVMLSAASDVVRKTRNASDFFSGLRRLKPGYYGMIVAHIGFAFTLLGASLNTIYSDQRDIRLTIGDSIDVAGYRYELADVRRIKGPNYFSDAGEIVVYDGDKVVVRLEPEKRKYFSGGNIMTEAAIDPGFFRDIYVALGDKLEGDDWAVRIHFKPVVRWIWLGAILMALGATITLTDKRYKKRKEAKVQESEKVDAIEEFGDAVTAGGADLNALENNGQGERGERG